MNELKQSARNCLEAYKQLPIELKREEIIEKLKNMVDNYKEISNKIGNDYGMFILNNTKNNIDGEDKLLSLIYEYLIEIENQSGKIIDDLSNN